MGMQDCKKKILGRNYRRGLNIYVWIYSRQIYCRQGYGILR